MNGKLKLMAGLLAGLLIGLALLVPVVLLGADVTPGYTFTSGEANVTHTKLNNSAAGTINTTFYSTRASAGTDPDTAFVLLLHDTINNVFKRSTLAEAVHNHGALLTSRTEKTAPVAGDMLLLADSADANAYKKMSWANVFGGATAITTVTNDDKLTLVRGRDTNAVSVTLSNVFAGVFNNTNAQGGDRTLTLSAGRGVVGTWRSNEVAALDSMTNAAGTERLRLLDGADFKQIVLSNLLGYFRTQLVTHYVLLEERTNNTVAIGGSGLWVKRSLNSNVVDTGSMCILSNNSQFVLLAGTYRFSADAPAEWCAGHQVRLLNVSTNGVVAYGTSEYSSGTNVATRSTVRGRFTVSSNSVFELQHVNGLGTSVGNFGRGGAINTTNSLATAEFWKEP